MSLKKQLMKLGSTNPELRKHIRPVLEAMGSKTARMELNPYGVTWKSRVEQVHVQFDTGASLKIQLGGKYLARILDGEDVRIEWD